MRPLRKKGVIDQLGQLITGLGVLAILAAVIFLIIAESVDQVVEQGPCENTTLVWNSTNHNCALNNASGTVLAGASHAWNATTTTQAATSDVPGWLPIVVITLIGGILLTLVRFFKSGK